MVWRITCKQTCKLKRSFLFRLVTSHLINASTHCAPIVTAVLSHTKSTMADNWMHYADSHILDVVTSRHSACDCYECVRFKNAAQQIDDLNRSEDDEVANAVAKAQRAIWEEGRRFIGCIAEVAMRFGL